MFLIPDTFPTAAIRKHHLHKELLTGLLNGGFIVLQVLCKWYYVQSKTKCTRNGLGDNSGVNKMQFDSIWKVTVEINTKCQ